MTDMSLPINQIIVGDALEVMRQLPAQCIHTAVTSPPYWGLRDYGTATWEGGDAECDHKGDIMATHRISNRKEENKPREIFKEVCGKCGANRIDQQLGLEKTPQEYLARMVAVFQEVKRVLRDDGTLWLNLGDSYSTGGRGGQWVGDEHEQQKRGWHSAPPGLKHKDLCGIPWRVAFALQADGWYLRQDIIWSKPNPMPESVTDRCTKAHEHLFLLTKKPKYFYDQQAIAEPCVESNATRPRMGQGPNTQYNQKRSDTGVGFGHGTDKEARKRDRVKTVRSPASWKTGEGSHGSVHEDGREQTVTYNEVQNETKNKRSVWVIPTTSFPDAHFATFPPDLIRPCILAGTSAKGCCPDCGAPWERAVEKESPPPEVFANRAAPQDELICSGTRRDGTMVGMGAKLDKFRKAHPPKTLGWRPTCGCKSDDTDPTGNYALEFNPVPCTVLDPFIGSGTGAMVAAQLNRNYVGIELNPEYAQMARERATQGETGITVQEARKGQRSLFEAGQ